MQGVKIVRARNIKLAKYLYVIFSGGDTLENGSRKNGFYLNVLSRSFGRTVSEQLEDTGLTPPQSRVLQFIAKRGDTPTYQNDVEQRMRLCASTTSAIIANLEKNGFITKESGDDKRYKRLALTDYGRDMTHRINEAMDIAEQQLVSGLDPEAEVAFTALLKRLLKNFSVDVDKIERCHDI